MTAATPAAEAEEQLRAALVEHAARCRRFGRAVFEDKTMRRRLLMRGFLERSGERRGQGRMEFAPTEAGRAFIALAHARADA